MVHATGGTLTFKFYTSQWWFFLLFLIWKFPGNVLRTGACPVFPATEWHGWQFFNVCLFSCVFATWPWIQLHVLTSTSTLKSLQIIQTCHSSVGDITVKLLSSELQYQYYFHNWKNTCQKKMCNVNETNSFWFSFSPCTPLNPQKPFLFFHIDIHAQIWGDSHNLWSLLQ